MALTSRGSISFAVHGPDEGTATIEFFGDSGTEIVAELKIEPTDDDATNTVVIVKNSSLVRLANTLDFLLDLT